MQYAPISRRRFSAALTLGVATLAAPAVRAQSRLEKTSVAIAVGGKASF